MSISDRLEALKAAADFVDERVAKRAVNARGYPEGPIISPIERWQLIEETAAFLLREDSE